jgi:hypothetical protein
MTQTELEKQINKILLKASFLDSNGSLGICQSYFKNVTKEIASLKMEGMYEREFVNWLLNEDCYQNNIWGISLSSEFKNNETEMCDFICERHGKYPVGIDDIIEYWQTNIKKQKP